MREDAAPFVFYWSDSFARLLFPDAALQTMHDFTRKADVFKSDMQRFLLSPKRWKASAITMKLNWQSLKFSAANQNQVPQKRGIYAFVVQHDNGHFPPHGYIMYVGITGADYSAGRTLRRRFYEYLQEQKRKKRPKVHYLLDKFRKDLYFHFVPIDDKRVNLGKLELQMNDAIIPPIVERDFTAEIRELVKVLG